MLNTIEVKLAVVLLVACLAWAALALAHNKGYVKGKAEVQALFDAHTENEKRLIEGAKIEKLIKEREQDDRAKAALAEYNGVVDELNASLDDADRLRAAASMLCGQNKPTLPVAEHPSSAVSEASAHTQGAAATPATDTGAAKLEDFYRRALEDTAQCTALIELVRKTQ